MAGQTNLRERIHTEIQEAWAKGHFVDARELPDIDTLPGMFNYVSGFTYSQQALSAAFDADTPGNRVHDSFNVPLAQPQEALFRAQKMDDNALLSEQKVNLTNFVEKYDIAPTLGGLVKVTAEPFQKEWGITGQFNAAVKANIVVRPAPPGMALGKDNVRTVINASFTLKAKTTKDNTMRVEFNVPKDDMHLTFNKEFGVEVEGVYDSDAKPAPLDTGFQTAGFAPGGAAPDFSGFSDSKGMKFFEEINQRSQQALVVKPEDLITDEKALIEGTATMVGHLDFKVDMELRAEIIVYVPEDRLAEARAEIKEDRNFIDVSGYVSTGLYNMGTENAKSLTGADLILQDKMVLYGHAGTAGDYEINPLIKAFTLDLSDPNQEKPLPNQNLPPVPHSSWSKPPEWNQDKIVNELRIAPIDENAPPEVKALVETIQVETQLLAELQSAGLEERESLEATLLTVQKMYEEKYAELEQTGGIDHVVDYLEEQGAPKTQLAKAPVRPQHDQTAFVTVSSAPKL